MFIPDPESDFSSTGREKNESQFTNNYSTLNQKNLNLSSYNMGLGSVKKPFPDPGVKKAPDRGSKTLPVTNNVL
jgi:hypothetical protein